jgi:hypothetical protein
MYQYAWYRLLPRPELLSTSMNGTDYCPRLFVFADVFYICLLQCYSWFFSDHYFIYTLKEHSFNVLAIMGLRTIIIYPGRYLPFFRHGRVVASNKTIVSMINASVLRTLVT